MKDHGNDTPKRGRPPIDAADRRDHSVLTRWTAEEIALVREAAQAAGVTVSEAIRRATLKAAKRQSR